MQRYRLSRNIANSRVKKFIFLALFGFSHIQSICSLAFVNEKYKQRKFPIAEKLSLYVYIYV
jgi:hypothetical protein